MTHKELVEAAVRWLKNQRCSVVLSEVHSTNTYERPDAIGWRHGRWSIMLECKTSRGDFFRDAKKYPRRSRSLSIGQARYFMTPAGLVKPAEVPDGWGLLWAYPTKSRTVKPAPTAALNKDVAANELPLLISALRRLQETEKGEAAKPPLLLSKLPIRQG